MKINSFFALTKHIKGGHPSYRDLIRSEAKIGGKLFGPVPRNRRREFFCLDERTWVWHEEWIDEFGNVQTKTTRFEVHVDRILKVQNGEYYRVEQNEAINLYQAAQLYYQRIKNELYVNVA